MTADRAGFTGPADEPTNLPPAQPCAACAHGDADRLLLLEAAFRHCPTAIMITDRSSRIVAVNPGFERLTGFTADDALGRTPALLKSGRHDDAFYRGMWQALLDQGAWQGEIWDRRKDGTHYPKWLSITALRTGPDQQITHFVAAFNDLTVSKLAEERIRALAYHDPLTGLPNRLLLHDRLRCALANARRGRGTLAVLFLDLDHFKFVNDSLGHAVGDRLLVEIARRLKHCVREVDTVARVGGDEFVIVLEHLHQRADAVAIVDKIHAAFAPPIDIDGRELHASASLGIALHPEDGEDAETLMRNADTAMYQAKAAGRDTYQFFAPFMNEHVRERLDLENTLRHALERGEFELHYQPIVDLRNDLVVGAEALIRWRRADDALVAPDRFIPIAEETGFIVEIGEWVMRRACRDYVAWRAQGIAPQRLSINVSPRQFREPGLASRIRAILRDSGMDAPELELEVTESALMQQPELAARILGELKVMGVGIAIDDFGTGYSSLAYLKTFPIDKLKIDRSFVRDILSDNSDREITQAVIALSHNLGLNVVAEGVENDGQIEFLRAHGCDCVQGYYHARPMPAPDYADYARHRRAA
jgi:diguanylate cyclase (GGDEF)-like protein/PAS domain S-box-containing protein